MQHGHGMMMRTQDEDVAKTGGDEDRMTRTRGDEDTRQQRYMATTMHGDDNTQRQGDDNTFPFTSPLPPYL